MLEVASKAALTPARKWLIELMQKINFGRIENLLVKNGEPVFEPLPRVVQEIKFNGDNSPRPELNSNNFELKSEVKQLFASLDQIENGCVETIEVRHGLPCHMSIEVAIQS